MSKEKLSIKEDDFNEIIHLIRLTILTFTETNDIQDVLELVLSITMVDILAWKNNYNTTEDDCKEYFSESAEKAFKLYKTSVGKFKKSHIRH
jgi:hypothetical protein